MINKEEYMNNLNKQLETWNAEVAKWQEKAKQAQAEQRAEYEKQVEIFQRQRDQAMEQMRKVQSASGEAWMEFTKGVDEAWGKMRDAYDKATEKFYK